MKKLLLLLACLYASAGAHAQCSEPQSQIDLNGKLIRARILNAGDLFNDFSSGQFIPDPLNPNSPSAIYTAGLWMGGLDGGANLRLSAAGYRWDGTDFSAGPLNDDGTTDAFTCANWDRHFLVTRAEIEAFLDALPMTETQAIAQYPGIMGWPGRFNTFFFKVWGFDLPPYQFDVTAPFVDTNGDGEYNPLKGDYPAVLLVGFPAFIADEMVWSVFNDQNGGAPHATNGKSLGVTVQQMAWTFNCKETTDLDKTVFTSHKIVYQGTEKLDSVYVGFWIDPDIGCSEDDYLGCDPQRNTMFAYNMDAIDGNIGSDCSDGGNTFGSAPPVLTVTLLGLDVFESKSLDNFVVMNIQGQGGSPVGTTDPQTPAEYYNYLSGSWRDGSPVTVGGSGYGGNTTTKFCFPGNPADPAGWSMCSTGLPFGDRRMIGSHHYGSMNPFGTVELTAAWTLHDNIAQPCNLGNALEKVDVIRDMFTHGFKTACSLQSNVPLLPADSIKLYPNPTADKSLVTYGSIRMDEIRIFDAIGRLIQDISAPGKGSTELDMSNVAAGMYWVELFSSEGHLTKKLTVTR